MGILEAVENFFGLGGAEQKPPPPSIEQQRLKDATRRKTQEELGIEAAQRRVKQFGQDIPRPTTGAQLKAFIETGHISVVKPAQKTFKTTSSPLPSEAPADHPVASLDNAPIAVPPVKPTLKVQ